MLRHHLRQHAEDDHLQRPRAGRSKRFERALIDLLDGLGEELADRHGAVLRRARRAHPLERYRQHQVGSVGGGGHG